MKTGARLGLTVLAVALFVPTSASAQVRLARCFDDHMVLQQGRKIPVWGEAPKGRKITVTFASQTKTTVAGQDGKWTVTLDPLTASNTGRTLVVQSAVGNRKSVIEDVVVGEVWLCSGQSNMYWALKSASGGKQAIAEAGNFPNIRILNYVAKPYGGGGRWTEADFDRLTRQRYMQGTWAVCSAKAAAPCSAVGFFFARQLHKALKIPIGLIHASKGGTPCESWVRPEAVKRHPRLKAMTEGDWFTNDRIGAWCRGRAKHNLANWFTRVAEDRAAGKTAPYRPRPTHPFELGCMWTFGIEPLVPLPLAGVVWYQGESNAETPKDIALHDDLLTLLIADWRKQWQCEKLPFLVVQLPRISSPGRANWPAFRASQARVARSLPDVGLAVTLDLGDNRRRSNVHPANKAPVGQRLALLARKIVYGQAVTHAGPVPKAVRAESGKLLVTFATGGSAIELRKDPHAGKVGFELAGADGMYRAAQAKVVGPALLAVNSSEVRAPVAVRYAWHMWPVVTLYNAAGLPAGPFQMRAAGAPAPKAGDR